ncbi:carboxypeptidase-like regulatory domain-containing protein [Hymenobacter cellulosivorans]|uniref:Carboxypeptidase-like regulatory domain-containing protein n=1 Tax=Hymenobacter cellulosivorans TaxID=2932249 RepID=A0ABY4FE96_9BACT|nr:carboxypeptidase-like regulatory domain-containing protein [Hymenobacter cellulosivorans]UOQ52781.1 carboxypeptidase-like regulatory domain-containing protein [Hymenobacter cellulosivorans]
MALLRSFTHARFLFYFMLRAFRPAVVLALAMGALLTSCDASTKDSDPAPAAVGAISGMVTVQDEVGQPVANKAGITVTLEGSSTSVSTVTGADGSFQLKNLPWGTYKIVYKRNDLGTIQEASLVLNEQHRTLARTATLGQLASTVVTSFSLGGDGPLSNSQAYTVGVNHNSAVYPDDYGFRIYMGATAGVSSTNYQFTSLVYSNQNPTQFWFHYADLLKRGFKSGDMVYLVVYGAPGREVTYADPANGRAQLVSNLNPTPSAVRSFVLP